MMSFNASSADSPPSRWRHQLDQFAKNHQPQLAALAWGLRQEWANPQEILGIDLKPTPHFIRCHYDEITQFNENVDGKLQEILGIIDHHNPQEEVVIIAIANSEVKLIYFQSNPTPPECFQQSQVTLDELIQQLETALQTITLES